MNNQYKQRSQPLLWPLLCGLSLGLMTLEIPAAWLNTYGSPDEEQSGHLIKANPGGYYLSGSLTAPDPQNPSQTQDFDLLARLNDQGQIQWAKKILGASVSPASDGSLSISPPSSSLTADVWAKGLVDPQTGAISVLSAKTISAATGYFLITSSTGSDRLVYGTVPDATDVSGIKKDMALAKLDANNNVVWSHVFDFNEQDSLPSVQKIASGYLLSRLVIQIDPQTFQVTASTLLGKLDANGSVVTGSPRLLGNSFSLGSPTVLSDGSVIVAGLYSTTLQSQGPSQFFLVKLDSDLNYLWGKRFFSPTGTESFTNFGVDELTDGTLEISPRREIKDANGTTVERHPGIMRLSKQGEILFHREVLVGTMDGFLFKQTDGKYYYSDNPVIPPKTDKDALYGRFGSDLLADWVRVIAGSGDDNASISLSAPGYLLGGSTSSFGAGKSDLLVGTLDANGLVGNCPEIQTTTATYAAPNISSADLGWSTTPATVTDRGPFSFSIVDATVNFTVSDANLAEAKVCESSSNGGGGGNGALQLSGVSATTFGLNIPVTLSGQGFGTKKGKVSVGKLLAKIVSWSDTAIVMTLQKGKAGAYAVKVTPRKAKSSSNSLTVTLHEPDVRTLSPSAGSPKDLITISGQYFGGRKPTVQFVATGKKKGKIAKVMGGSSDNSVTVRVPKLKSGQTYQVTVGNGAGKSDDPAPFQVP